MSLTSAQCRHAAPCQQPFSAETASTTPGSTSSSTTAASPSTTSTSASARPATATVALCRAYAEMTTARATRARLALFALTHTMALSACARHGSLRVPTVSF